MSTGIRVAWKRRVWIRIQVRQVSCQNKEPSTELVYFKNRVGLCKGWDHMWVCTPLVPRFPSLWAASSLTSLAYCQCCFFMLRERKTSEVPTLCLTEPLPGLLAAVATLFVRWFFLFVFRVTFDSDSLCCFIWSGTFICVLAELFLCILHNFSFCFLFKLCIEFFLCVCEIKAFINLMLVWLLFLRRTHFCRHF